MGLLAHHVYASEYMDRYRSIQIVYDKSQNTLQQSITAAFNHVLSKQTGTVISQHDWSQTPPQIETMVERYDYTKTTCEDERTCYKLAINFNPESIQHTLQAIQLTPWHGKRPSTLLWLQAQQSEADTYPLVDAYTPTAQWIHTEAKQRAIPLLLPTGDITDQQLATKEPQVPTLDYLQSKYHTQQILVGSFDRHTNDNFTFHWHLYNKKHHHDWESTASSLETGISGAINHIVSLAKLNQKQAPASLQKSIIEIKNISQYDDFKQISSQLTASSSIKKVAIIAIGADFFALELQHQGTSESLIEQLQTFTCLQSNIESPSTESAIASYQWLPDFKQKP